MNYHDHAVRKKIWYSAQIKRIAERKHFSCAELALMSGLSEDCIYAIYQSEIVPTRRMLEKIAIALEVPITTVELPADF
jgi:transcriptional regulator with XRE-family HTH domain